MSAVEPAARLRFTKMHGLGNDYVYVDLFDQTLPAPPETLAPQFSDRHTGIGGDGLILLEPPDTPEADVRMRMYNADGTRARMCGNGIRCIGKLAWERGRARRNPLRVQTDAGILTLQLVLVGEQVDNVRVDLGPPRLDPDALPALFDGPRVIDVPLVAGGVTLNYTCVSMGNPHAVAFVGDVMHVPLAEWGPEIEWHARFPERINVHYAQVLDRGRLRMVTWERGSGPTRACGTGACAVLVAGVLTGRCERIASVSLPGGELRIEWPDAGPAEGRVFMSGPAVEVFRGELALPLQPRTGVR
jgi:diaminopimelate epimerase